MTEALSEVARSIQSAWAAAFARADWPGIAMLYTSETAFFGSSPALRTDRAGVLSYFTGLPAGYVAAEFGPPQILPLGPEVFAASGTVVFTVQADGKRHDHAYRMSQVFRHTPEGWRIALHHASPRPG